MHAGGASTTIAREDVIDSVTQQGEAGVLTGLELDDLVDGVDV